MVLVPQWYKDDVCEISDHQPACYFTPASVKEILFVAFMLVRKKNLPIDVVNDILAATGLALAFEIESTELLRGRNDMDHLYLALTYLQRKMLASWMAFWFPSVAS